MTRMAADSPPVVLSPRTCARCGSRFGALGREYLCRRCRKPVCHQRIASRGLTQRERQIVSLIQQAKANKEIAFSLNLTVGTVKEYLRIIFRKLNISNRTELAIWGIHHAVYSAGREEEKSAAMAGSR